MRDSTIGSIVRITAADQAVHQIATELGWHDSHVISQYAALVVVAIALVDENCCGTEGYGLGTAKAEGMAGRTVVGGASLCVLGGVCNDALKELRIIFERVLPPRGRFV